MVPTLLLLPGTPYGEYVTAVEQACMKLEPHSTEELTAKMRGALRHSQNPKSNITKEEVQALAELKKDQSRVILTADMDREEYNKKAQELLERWGNLQKFESRSNKQNEEQINQPTQEDQSRGGH